MSEMTRKQRVLAACAGKKVDRCPVSLWYHFRLPDPSGASLAEAELAFFRRYQPDFLKVMHDIPYQLPDGMSSVETPSDWRKLTVLDPRTGNFGRQLEALKMILGGLGDDPPPVIDTVFNVFGYAQKVSGNRVLEHLKQDRQAVVAGLSAIADSLAAYAGACADIGLSGIYLAVSGANKDIMSEAEYGSTFLALDRRVLDGNRGRAEFNVVHLHGPNLMYELVSKLPCHALSWSDRLHGPSLGEGRRSYGGAVVGGINEGTAAEQTPEQMAADVSNALSQMGGKHLLVAPGCAVPTPTTEAEMAAWDARMAAVRREVESYPYHW